MIKLQCVVYQGIRLNEFCQLMKSFFKFRVRFRIFDRKPNFFKRIARYIGQIAICCISMDSSQQALQTNEKLFFKLVFEILADNRKMFKRIERREY